MSFKNYDLAVAYRIYPKVSKNPPIFSDDKFKLAEFCLKSFKASLGSLKVKIWAILDNCPKQYETLFTNHFKQSDLKIIKLEGLGNKATFKLQIDILLEQSDSDMVYFAEDDYFYFPNQFKEMITFFKKNPQVDFVSPYDHPDLYHHGLHEYKNYIKISPNHHWRTLSTTTCTFLTTKDTLAKTKKILKLYSEKPVDDAIMFTILSKKGVRNPSSLISSLLKKQLAAIYYRAWRHGWKYILFGKKRKLWCPIPTIGTHMESTALSPTINWEDAFKPEKINPKTK